MERWVAFYYSARQRCNDKNRQGYKNYGGRGIKCLMTKDDFRKLWIRGRASRLKQPSIDRIDNDGHYTFSNCRFIELGKNAMIRRNTTKKECPKGHPYSGKNLYMNISNGFKNRVCMECARGYRRKYRAKIRGLK